METERNIETHPYDKQEERVANYILKLTDGQIGAGSDPVQFLISSHAALAQHIQELSSILNGEWDRVVKEVGDFVEVELHDHPDLEKIVSTIRSMSDAFTASQPSAEPEQQKPE